MATDQFERMCEENRILYRQFIMLMVEAIRKVEEREKAIMSTYTVAQESENGIKFSADIKSRQRTPGRAP